MSSHHHFTHASAPVCQACGLTDLRLQCLRVLRCTARALVGSPGGLRFKAGTRPWLEGLEGLEGHEACPSLPPLCTAC